MLTEEQLKIRRSGIGGSDAGVVAGVDPYRQPLELYLEKRGELKPADLSDNNAVHFGNVLEPICAEEYTRRTGNKVRRVNRTLRHQDLSFVIGHIDRDVVGQPRALEIKTASAWMSGSWGKDGTDEVPNHNLVQTQHYMALLPKIEVFDLAVLMGGNDFRIYHIPRDKGLIDDLLALESRFWNDHVLAGSPPEIDYDHKSTNKLIARMYPGTNGETVELPNDALHWKAVMDQAAEQAKKYKAVADSAKDHIRSMLGDAAVGILPDNLGGFTRKVVKRSAYQVDAMSYIDFRFTKKPKRT